METTKTPNPTTRPAWADLATGEVVWTPDTGWVQTDPGGRHVHQGPTPPPDTDDRRYGPVEKGTEGRCACGAWVRAVTVPFAGSSLPVQWVRCEEDPFDPSTEL